jgi:hypothetical protein
MILEFGSVTFILISLLMAFANYRIRHLTRSSARLRFLPLSGCWVGPC